MLGWTISPPGATLVWLFISSTTIKITACLFSRELEVDLSRSNINDHVRGVDEWSSKDDGCIIFFFQDHEIGIGKLIMYSYHDIFSYPLRKLDWLVHHLQLHVRREQRFITKQIFICYLGHYVDPWSNVAEGLVENSLPMVHSIIGTPRSSFFSRNGEARRWSYLDPSVLIMLIVSPCGCLALFFLLRLFFFFLVAGVSSDGYGVYGCLGEWCI